MIKQPASDEGFTIIEVLVAAFILVLGALAVFMAFAAGVHNIQRSRETQVGISVAQREVEKIKALDYASISMTAPPTYSGSDRLPGNRLLPQTGNATSFDVEKSSATRGLPLVLTGTERRVEPGPSQTTSPDGTKVNVWRFVTCEIEASGTCLAKRIVVDVRPVGATNLGSYEHSYSELQSTATAPTP
jgi:type II secretory pathway pseudopilin PulG